jgi:hypothetical protein
MPLYLDAAAMRASRKYSPVQIRDTMIARIKRGYYRAPSSYSDIGIDSNSSQAPFLAKPGAMVLGGSRKGPYGYLISPLNEAEKAEILASAHSLLKRLEDYKPYFKVEGMSGHH